MKILNGISCTLTATIFDAELPLSERDGVRATYNRAEHLPERMKAMKSWADYLDELKHVAEVVNYSPI